MWSASTAADSLERVSIDSVGTVDARGLFCFIGADPATSWLRGLDRDADGFLRTGTDIAAQSLAQWQTLGREPLPFETSIPGCSPPATFGAGR